MADTADTIHALDPALAECLSLEDICHLGGAFPIPPMDEGRLTAFAASNGMEAVFLSAGDGRGQAVCGLDGRFMVSRMRPALWSLVDTTATGEAEDSIQTFESLGELLVQASAMAAVRLN